MEQERKKKKNMTGGGGGGFPNANISKILFHQKV